MVEQSNRKCITQEFNIAVFFFSAVLGIFSFLMTSDKVKNVPLEGLILSIGFDAIRFITVLLISALIIKEFWNRLIANIFSLRDINFQEAIAIILVLSVTFGK